MHRQLGRSHEARLRNVCLLLVALVTAWSRRKSLCGLTADMMDGGAEIITGGKPINGGLLCSISRFQTDESAVAPAAERSLPTER